MTPKENTVKVIVQLLDLVEQRIEASHAKGENLPATGLARELGPKFGWNWGKVYQIINIYVENHPELEIRGGLKGGIARKGGKKKGASVLNIDAIDLDKE